MITQEYHCADHGLFSLHEPCNENESPRACPDCNEPAEYRMSAPMTRVRIAEAIRGSSQERPPGALDTRPLAEGMKLSEWQGIQRKKAVDERRAWVKRVT